MFNLKSLIKNTKISTSKTFLDNASSLEAIKAAKEKTEERDEKVENKYNIIYKEGLDAFIAFTYDNEKDNLKLSADKFSEAIEIKKTKAEPYFYLANIFCILGEIETSIKYMQIASFLDPNLNGLSQLRENIESMIS